MTDKRYLPEGSLLGTQENIFAVSSLSRLESAMEYGRTVEGIVTMCDCTAMELHVRIGQTEGVIPKSEAVFSPDGSPVKDIALITRVGKPVAVKITAITHDRGVPKLWLSRRAAQKECYEQYITSLRCGDIIPARVTHLDPFGAFVDIGCGIVSLLSVDCISVSRIAHPSDRLSPGEAISAVVKSIDRESGRIYMSLRELLGTWEENAAMFSPLTTVRGIVRSVETYGVFVELTPNLAGLAERRDDVEAGDFCSVYIKNIIPERMKIKLVMIDTHATPVPMGLRYFVDVDRMRHITSWHYSPPSCDKIIETVFE